MISLAILASGNGSNAEAIMNFFEQNPSQGSVALVIASNEQAYVLERAKNHGVKSLCISKKMMNSEPDLLRATLADAKIDVVVLAGYMLLIPRDVVAMFPNKIINIHPALLPKFGGKGMYGGNVHNAVIANKETESGITIHFVNEQYDKGDVIFQAKCEVLEDDDADTLAAKIHTLEHKFYPQIINQVIAQL